MNFYKFLVILTSVLFMWCTVYGYIFHNIIINELPHIAVESAFIHIQGLDFIFHSSVSAMYFSLMITYTPSILLFGILLALLLYKVV